MDDDSTKLFLTLGRLKDLILEPVRHQHVMNGPRVKSDVGSISTFLEEWVGLRVVPEESQEPSVLLGEREGARLLEKQQATCSRQRGGVCLRAFNGTALSWRRGR